MNRRTGWLMLALGMAALSAAAADLELFSAAKADVEPWGWGGAKIIAADKRFKVVENNRTGDYGDVFVAEKFAYVPEAFVELDVDRVIAGVYTLQVLAFKGDSHVGTFDVFKDCPGNGVQKFKLGTAPLPADTETVLFKIWVAGMEGATVMLNDLRYYMPVDPASVLADIVVTPETSCSTDKAVWAPADAGGTITLATGESFGSVLFPDEIVKPETGGSLVLQIPSVVNGSLTAQLAVLNESGTYVTSLDALTRVGAGLRMARLDTLQWPPNAVRFQVKLWLEGPEGCSAVVQRVLVLK